MFKSADTIGAFFISRLCYDRRELDTGVYYSIRESGVAIWQLLLLECAPDVISTLVVEKYSLNQQEVSTVVNMFIKQLLDENIVVVNVIEQKNKAIDFSSIVWCDAFLTPSLEKYEDMMNLLMLDPVHEVDEQGWPSRLVETL